MGNLASRAILCHLLILVLPASKFAADTSLLLRRAE